MQSKTYQVELENFQGPLDLLLQLIERQKLDICDITLSKVTDDYLQYVELSELDPDQANWFLAIAAKLILAKSRALLPGGNDKDEPDDIEALATQLKTLQMFQLARSEFLKLAKQPLLLRPNYSDSQNIDSYVNLTTVELTQSYRSLGKRELPAKRPFRLKRQSNKALRAKLMDKILATNQLNIDQLHQLGNNSQDTVLLFLLVLELVKTKKAFVGQNNSSINILATA